MSSFEPLIPPRAARPGRPLGRRRRLDGPLISEIVKAGLGWLVAGYLWLQYSAEIRSRRVEDQAMRDLLLKITNDEYAKRQEISDRQTDVLGLNSKMIEAHTATLRNLAKAVEATLGAILAGIVGIISAVAVAFLSGGSRARNRAAAQDAQRETETYRKAKEAEHAVDDLSDDAVLDRLRKRAGL